VLLCILGAFMTEKDASAAETSVWPPCIPKAGYNATLGGDMNCERMGFLDGYGNLASFIFAFQGQSMFLEIMREMKDAKQFRTSLFSANGTMGVIYTITTCIAYYYNGHAVAGFLPFSLPNGGVKTFVGVLLCFHIIVSYLLTAQPLTFKIHEALSPYSKFDYAQGGTGQMVWLGLTACLLVFAFMVANAIPFFSDFQNIIGSGLGAPIVFGWPAYFYLKACALNGVEPEPAYKKACYVFLFVLLPSCTIFGLISALSSLASDWQTFGKPFECHLVGY